MKSFLRDRYNTENVIFFDEAVRALGLSSVFGGGRRAVLGTTASGGAVCNLPGGSEILRLSQARRR